MGLTMLFKRKYRNGFSLVEMMVSFVIICVIATALTPIITKKMKSATVSIDTEGDFITNCTDKFSSSCTLCTTNKCVMCNKECPSDQTLDYDYCTCSSCITSFGANCLECSETSCTRCKNEYFTNNGTCEICPVGYYCDGINKTICPEGQYNEETGQTTCLDCPIGHYCTNGEKKACEAGTYSTGKASECTTCPVGHKCIGGSDKTKCTGAEYQSATGQSACQLCAAGNYVIDARVICTSCTTGNKCTGDGTQTLCSTGAEYQNESGKSTCKTCDAGYYVSSDRKSCNTCTIGNKCTGNGVQTACNNASGTAGNQYQDQEGQSTCKTCTTGIVGGNGATCHACTDGTYLSSGNCVTCPGGYYCNNGTPKQCWANSSPNANSGATNCVCNAGYYLSETKTCSTCSSKTEHCATCNVTDGTCLSCEDGYTLSDENECKLACKDYATIIETNGTKLCMTTYNIGDASSLTIPSTINNVDVGSGGFCESTEESCCWSGTTAEECDDGNSDYSGCDRTVCNYNAAEEICTRLTYLGRTWRLPTTTEMNGLRTSTAVGTELNFCDLYSGYYFAAQCTSSGICEGADGNSCNPNYIWANSFYSAGVLFANYYEYSSGALQLMQSNISNEGINASVRCVSDY